MEGDYSILWTVRVMLMQEVCFQRTFKRFNGGLVADMEEERVQLLC